MGSCQLVTTFYDLVVNIWNGDKVMSRLELSVHKGTMVSWMRPCGNLILHDKWMV